MKKQEVVNHLAFNTGLSKDQIREVFDQLSKLTERELRENKEFIIPGLVRFSIFLRKGMPARTMRDRRTWLNRTIQCKPSKPKWVVRATPTFHVKKMVLPVQDPPTTET